MASNNNPLIPSIRTDGGGGAANVATLIQIMDATFGVGKWAVQLDAITTSALFDASFGSDQGRIAYRTDTGWVGLAPGTSGYVLTSGGAAANISWVAPTTGSGTVNSGLSGMLAYYPSDGTTVDDIALTTAIDTLYSTQGGILYRGASVWGGLDPGTAGQMLISGGAAANPSYVYAPPPVFRMLTPVTLTAAATATILSDSGARGSRTIPANFFAAGKGIRVRLAGYGTTSGTPGTASIQIKLGSTAIGNTDGNMVVGTSKTNGPWNAYFDLICESAGATGTCNLNGNILSAAGLMFPAMTQLANGTLGNAPQTPIVIDTTGTLVLDITMTLSVGTNSITTTDCVVEALG